MTKGQKGIRILAPCIRKQDEETPNGATEKVARIAGFRSVAVFDISQTSGEDLPALAVNATEGGDALLPLLENAITTAGITLTYATLEGAYGLSRGGAIEIEASLDTPARCGVLVHEWAHEMLQHKANRETTTKQRRELEAESIAYAVLSQFGMSLPSQFYLATYGVTAEMLTAALQTTKHIIGLLFADTGKEDSGEDADLPALAA